MSNQREVPQYERPEIDTETTPYAPDLNTNLNPHLGSSNQEKQSPPSELDIQIPPRTLHGLSWITVVLAILSSTLLFALDNTITADIQPAIVDAFHDTAKLTWISVAFLLTAAGTNLLWGRLYGNFEGKWLYVFTIAIFEIGSALCGAAPDMNVLILGRAICGFGGVGMYLGVLSLLSALTSIAERPVYMAMVGVIWGIGTVCGPFVGGGFADSHATWRWGFYINLCVGAIFAPVYLFLIPRIDPRPGVSFLSRSKDIDWIGAVLLFGTMVSLLMGIGFGGLTYAWNSGSIITLFVVAGVLFIILAIQQIFAIGTTEQNRLFPFDFLKSKEMFILFIETACAGTATFIPIYFIPLLFQLARGTSALAGGLHLLPYILLLVTMNMINGFGMGHFGYYMPWFTGGSILVIIGSALLYTINTTTSNAAIYGYTIIYGIGIGSFSQAPFSIAQALVPESLTSLAIGFISCAQIGGAAIGLAIGDTVFLNEAQSAIGKVLMGVDVGVIQGVISGVGSDYFDGLGKDTQGKIVYALVKSFDKAFVLAIVAGSIALVGSVFMNRGKLNLSGVPTVG